MSFLSACGGAGGGLASSAGPGNTWAGNGANGETNFIDEPIDIPVTPAKIPSVMRVWFADVEFTSNKAVIEGRDGVIPGAQYSDVMVTNEATGMSENPDVEYENEQCAQEGPAVSGCTGSFQEIEIALSSPTDVIRFEPSFLNGDKGTVVYLRSDNGVPVWSLHADGRGELYRGTGMPSAADAAHPTPLTPVIPSIETPSTGGSTIQPLPGRTSGLDPNVDLGRDIVVLPPSGR